MQGLWRKNYEATWGGIVSFSLVQHPKESQFVWHRFSRISTLFSTHWAVQARCSLAKMWTIRPDRLWHRELLDSWRSGTASVPGLCCTIVVHFSTAWQHPKLDCHLGYDNVLSKSDFTTFLFWGGAGSSFTTTFVLSFLCLTDLFSVRVTPVRQYTSHCNSQITSLYRQASNLSPWILPTKFHQIISMWLYTTGNEQKRLPFHWDSFQLFSPSPSRAQLFDDASSSTEHAPHKHKSQKTSVNYHKVLFCIFSACFESCVKQRTGWRAGCLHCWRHFFSVDVSFLLHRTQKTCCFKSTSWLPNDHEKKILHSARKKSRSKL